MKRAALLLAVVIAPRAATAADAGPPPTPAAASDRLPEDPVAGAKSTADWRAFMAQEERERRLNFDRRRLKQHRALVRTLKAARARYDRARTVAAVEAIRAGFPATADEAHRRMTEIDHWGNNSNLLADYDAILKVLSGDYPSARLAELRGDRTAIERARAELRERDKKIAAWLRDAAASKDE